MRLVELVPGIHSSALGFGGASILGAVDGQTARRALDCAADYGVNHLDLARSYGYGEAEAFVGTLLKGRRNQFVVATKFGIEANWKARLVRPLKPFVRLMRGPRKGHPAPGGPAAGSGPALPGYFHDRPVCRGALMRKSLEKSLRALKTDRVEYFFVHEPHERLVHLDELIETADRCKEEGKIRAFGLAYMNEQRSLHEAYLEAFDVLQSDNLPPGPAYEQLIRERAGKPTLFFSPLKGGSPELKPAEKLRQLAADFPKSVILCSMFNEAHIRANVQAV
jgi:aryl-alcohol dehydrogenase-like predicted oxidoreductase